MGCNYLSISKLHLCIRWSLETDTLLHPTPYDACYYLSMGELELNHGSEVDPNFLDDYQ